jgi:sugar phosphate isomerase/epimerase
VIFCEGEASEPDYLQGLRRLPGVRRDAAVDIEIATQHGVPLILVQTAVERIADDEVDECWCVFDVEWPRNHPGLREASELARAHGIGLAVSNPCFELWLILHFEDQSAHLTTQEAERRSRKLDGRSNKRIDPARYLPHRQEAGRRASVLAELHAGNGTSFPKDNPSSTVGDLLTAIER